MEEFAKRSISRQHTYIFSELVILEAHESRLRIIDFRFQLHHVHDDRV